MASRRPKTGEARKTNQPLKIDKLPSAVHDAICALRNSAGLPWQRIEDISAESYSPDWQSKGGGFVDWQELPLPILELFPDLKLPKSNLQRWYDIRVAQVREATMERSDHARVLAESFAGSTVKGDKDAVLFAARDIFFGILSEDGSLASRAVAGKALLSLAKEQQKARTNDIRERQVGVAERNMAQLERDADDRRNRMNEESEKLKNKAAKGGITAADIDRLRERVFGLPPKAEAA